MNQKIIRKPIRIASIRLHLLKLQIRQIKRIRLNQRINHRIIQPSTRTNPQQRNLIENSRTILSQTQPPPTSYQNTK
ncbi:hypothetical protein HanXRQr2_Chr02g0074711 [Helianthus annuus]|uniref:Uncharacterized protein n=1 Tax=Helianthus annuus TaxID=4232 RepID=A0A9K3JPW5_HELAN|nr:hypothetical protein HanXRQr2_Chr02g0074711 [Helianthus annuus]